MNSVRFVAMYSDAWLWQNHGVMQNWQSARNGSRAFRSATDNASYLHTVECQRILQQNWLEIYSTKTKSGPSLSPGVGPTPVWQFTSWWSLACSLCMHW